MPAVTIEFEDGTERTFPHTSSVYDSVANGIVTVCTFEPTTLRSHVENLPMTLVSGWRDEPHP